MGLLENMIFYYQIQGIIAWQGEIFKNCSADWKLHLRFLHLTFEKAKKFKTNRSKIPLLKLSKAIERVVKWNKTSEVCRLIKNIQFVHWYHLLKKRCRSFWENLNFLRNVPEFSKASQKKTTNPMLFHNTCFFKKKLSISKDKSTTYAIKKSMLHKA